MTDPYQQPPPGGQPPPPPGYGQQGGGYGYPMQYGPPGRIRGTGFGIFLFIITCGIYGWYWFFSVHDEMKRHSGEGLGGPIALLIAIVSSLFLAGALSPFLTSHEVGQLHQRAGRASPVSAMTGLWVFPGMFLIVLPIVWFVKTNGALNDYWRSVGAR